MNIDVSGMTEATGKIYLRVNWVDRMRGGVSFGGTNIVAVCTKAWWKTKSPEAQNGAIIHEVGHQLGMAASGKGILPDKISTFYDSSKGHKGPHCHAGIARGQERYDGKKDKAASKCMMYGATNGISAFCNECSKALKKVD